MSERLEFDFGIAKKNGMVLHFCGSIKMAVGNGVCAYCENCGLWIRGYEKYKKQEVNHEISKT